MNEEDDAEEEDEEEDKDEDKDDEEDKDDDSTHAIFIADLYETKPDEGERELEGEQEARSK